MSTIQKLYSRLIDSMGVDDLEIPLTAVKFYKNSEDIPEKVVENQHLISLTSCQASKQASLGDAALLTIDNIGCIAAAITFGLVDQNHDSPLAGPRVYTDVMQKQSELGANFKPPSPKDFTDGIVYACKSANRQDFALFGKDDCGRFKDSEIAKNAISDMMAIQPPIMKGVFFYSMEFDEIDLLPDVIVLSVRPVELTRLIQAYQFNSGKRVTASMGGLRVVNSDLIVRPYLTKEINISTYCLGARLIAEYEANRLGIGIPYNIFEEIVKGMEDSQNGFPFHLYPGASQGNC